MSEGTKPTEAAKALEPVSPQGEPPPPPHATLRQSLQAADPVSLGALGTAVVAGIIGIVQTGFMWIARNDEVEAALRGEQLRACVAYRIAGNNAIARAQLLAEENGGPAEGDEDFQGYVLEYEERLAQLYYLLPSGHEDAIDAASERSADAYVAYVARDAAQLTALTADDEQWVFAHDELLNACEDVIRDVRDR